MKTLDEVIKALRCTDPEVDPETKCNDCPYKEFRISDLWYVGPSCLDVMFADALHYLKNYRDTKEWLDLEKRNYAEAVKNCEMAEAKYTQMTLDMNRNVPLTWEQLKGMEGKPVWIELLNHDMWDDPSHRVDSEWWVIGEVRKDDIILATYLDEMELFEDDLGVIWQAYRKERK